MPGHSKRKPNPNATPPQPGEVAYKNKSLVQRIADRVSQGVPIGSASLCEGLSRDTVHMWISRAGKLQAEGKSNKALQDAVSTILRARGEAEASASQRAHSDPKNAPEFWLQRQMRQEFGLTQVVQVEGIDPAQAVGLALQNLLGDGDVDE